MTKDKKQFYINDAIMIWNKRTKIAKIGSRYHLENLDMDNYPFSFKFNNIKSLHIPKYSNEIDLCTLHGLSEIISLYKYNNISKKSFFKIIDSIYEFNILCDCTIDTYIQHINNSVKN